MLGRSFLHKFERWYSKKVSKFLDGGTSNKVPIYLNLSPESELYILSNAKVCTAKDRGENYMMVRPPGLSSFA